MAEDVTPARVSSRPRPALRRVLAALVVLAILPAGTAAARHGRVESLRLRRVQVVPATLYPAGAGDLSLRIYNPNRRAVTVTSVVPWGRVQPGGCGVALIPQHGLRLRVRARRGQTFVLPDAVPMAATAPDSCQGVLFRIHIRVRGR